MVSESSRGTRRYASIGKYEIVTHVATGGMAAVYRARDTETAQTVALKVLSPALAEKPVVLERFRREAARGLRLRHPNLVTIYEFGEANGVHFLAQEYVDGRDLHDYIADKCKLDTDEACLLLTQAVKALDYLHRQSVVHRDIKPSNFLIAAGGDGLVVKLTDLGLAREPTAEEFRVTRADLTVGTVDYMAPEQARNSSLADIRSDIYSLGCTFFHMLTGGPPFAEGGLTERLYQHAEAEPPDVRQQNPSVPPAVVKILKRMLAKKPEQRYQTPGELLADLQRFRELSRIESLVVAQRSTGRETPPDQPARVAPSSSFLKAAAASEGRPVAADDSTPVIPGVADEQRLAAAGQFERAKEVVETGNDDYAIHLLRSCCKLDPAKLSYRKTLRQVEKNKYQDRRRVGWMSWATNVAAKAKIRSALQAGDYLKVLEVGEVVLAKNPWDRDTQLNMAKAAEGLGAIKLAGWIMKEVWEDDREDADVNREIARFYDNTGDLARAIRHWKIVAKVDPADFDAPRQVQDLSARLALERGQYEKQVGDGSSLQVRLRRA